MALQKAILGQHQSVENIFLNRNFHIAFSDRSGHSERDYARLLTERVLSEVLPIDDLSSDCERILLRDCFAALGIQNTINKLSDPYFMKRIIVDVCGL